MKKLTILTLATTVLTLVGCGVTPSDCSHNYQRVDLVEPTTTQAGKEVFECELCEASYSNEIPKLDEVNYTLSKIEASCETAGYDVYTSSEYGTYKVQTADKLDHTNYGGLCDLCYNSINNFHFFEEDITKIYNGGGYPRLYELQDGTWLCGFDTAGFIGVVRSDDQGATWDTSLVCASTHSAYACANVAFHQFENGDILCAYRAIGKESDPYGRYIQCTISKDNGYTWEFHSTIEDNYNLGFSKEAVDNAVKNEGRLGFFEPHFGMINDKLTVMYADDFTTMLENKRENQALNYETQYIVAREWDGSKWSDRKIILDGTKKKSVDIIYDYSRDGMPVFTQMHNGTYVLAVEGTYRRNPAYGNNPFIILLSYSKDGVKWSDPVEVYVPKISGAKASAPYICVTSDDRLVISFQTDEDCVVAGRGFGDGVSVMKTIISDGTPVEKISKRNFFEAQNVFSTPVGYVSSWNGMMMKDDVIYCVTGSNYPSSGIYMNSAPVPSLDEVGTDYTEVQSSGYTTRNGKFAQLKNGWLMSKLNNSLLTFDNQEVENGSISIDMIPFFYNDCGLVFKATSSYQSYWETPGNSYYVLLINYIGDVLLGKIDDAGRWSLLDNSTVLMPDFNRNKVYNLKVVLEHSLIECYVNDELLITYEDSSTLTGTGVGVRAGLSGVLFKDLVCTQ